jgi:hypothetical protein
VMPRQLQYLILLFLSAEHRPLNGLLERQIFSPSSSTDLQNSIISLVITVYTVVKSTEYSRNKSLGFSTLSNVPTINNNIHYMAEWYGRKWSNLNGSLSGRNPAVRTGYFYVKILLFCRYKHLRI